MEQPQSANKTIVIILLLVLVTLGISVFFLYQKQQKVRELNTHKSVLIGRLADMIRANDTLMAENDSINQLIAEKRTTMVGMIDSVSQVGASQTYQMSNYELAVSRLRDENELLKEEALALRQTNQQLKAEKEEALFSLRKEKAVNDSLTEVVKDASPLRLSNMNAVAYNIKRKGEEPTTSAWRAEKLEVCYELPSNAIAGKGLRTVHLRVKTPEGLILKPNGEAAADTSAEKIFYTARQVINFQGVLLKSCIEYNFDDFDDGTYRLELYVDGKKQAEQTLLLD